MDKYVLQNKFGIKDEFTLNKEERRYTAIRIIELREKNFHVFSFNTLKYMQIYFSRYL